MAANDHHNNNINPAEDQEQQPIRRGYGRKKSSSSTAPKKKQPQRGMGVQKLEELRQKEMFKKMAAINPKNQGFSLPTPSFGDPALINGSVKVGGFGAPNIGQMGLHQNQGFLGLHGQMGRSPGFVNDQLIQPDLFGVGLVDNNSGFLIKNVSGGVSKELSSNPNAAVKGHFEHCKDCHKKKRVESEDIKNGGVRSDMYAKMCNIGGDIGFLGLNVGDSLIMKNQENQGFGIKAPLVPQVGYTLPHGKPGVEVVAAHKKGSVSSGGGSVLMEYEFFPVRSDSVDNNDGLVMTGGAAGAAGHAGPGWGSGASSSWPCKCGSSAAEATAGFDGGSAPSSSSSSCIDLSLKLSY